MSNGNGKRLWISDQINTLYSGFLGGTATAGVAGGPTMVRATEVRGITKVHRFTVEFEHPNPLPDIPVDPDDKPKADDTIVLAWMDPTERIYFGRVFALTALGAQVKFGKIDTNFHINSDDDHYLAATTLAVGTPVDFNLNMTEQVGADPRGDQTYGNWIPAFGSGKIWLTTTLSGTPSDDGKLVGFVLCVEEGN